MVAETKLVADAPLQITSKILVVTQNLPPAICGVGDYATLFAQELAHQNPELSITFLSRVPRSNDVNYATVKIASDFLDSAEIYPSAPFYWKLSNLPTLLKTVRKSRARIVHIHYAPHMYYRAGVGVALSIFSLLLCLMRLRMVVTFHELYIPWSKHPKQFLIGLAQRLSFFLLLLAAHNVVVTTDLRAQIMHRWLWWQPAKARRVVVAPVGSNFPEPVKLSVQAVSELRQSWKLPTSGLILSSVGQLRWQQPDWLLATLNAIQTQHSDMRLLLIGCERDQLPKDHPISQRTDVICTGHISASEVSTLLSISDIYLLPLEDGVSARRTALMAALQHGLPIVSTRGHNTEPAFANDLPVLLAPVKSLGEFVRLTKELVANSNLRQSLGQQATTYYHTNFAWGKIVEQQKPLFQLTLSKPKRILYFTPFAERGGAETVLLTLLKGLDRSCYEPYVVFIAEGPLVKDLTDMDIRVKVLGKHRRREIHKMLQASLALTYFILHNKIDLVHTFGTGPHLYTGLACLLTRRPEVWQIFDPYEGTTLSARLINRINLTLPYARVIMSSTVALNSYRPFIKLECTLLIYPAVKLPQLHSAVELKEVRLRYELSESDLLFITVSRLQRAKGHHFLLEAAPIILTQYPTAKFIFVGAALFGMGQDYEQQLKAQVVALGLEEKVIFTGFCSEQDKECLLQISQILLHPAVSEPFGLALIEAMALGKPIVAARVWGPSEIVIDGVTGRLVEPANPTALALAVCEVMTDPARLTEWGENGRKRAYVEYGFDIMLQKITQVYQALLN